MGFWKELRKKLLGKKARAKIAVQWLEAKGVRPKLIEALGEEQGGQIWALIVQAIHD